MITLWTKHDTTSAEARGASTIVAALTALVLFGVAAAPEGARAGEPGSSGALFLRMGMGARASGMGEAFSAMAADASAAYWNPGAMAAVLGTNVVLMHNEYLQSVRLEQAAVTHETEYGTLGLSFTGLYMDDMERREDVPSAVPLGRFSAYDVAFSVGFSRYVLPNLSVGVAVKPVYEKIDERASKGLAFDVGVFHVSRIEGVTLAAVVANVGAPMKFEGEDYALPRYIKVGGSYERESETLHGRLILTLDGLFPNDGDVKEHAGVEYAYRRRVFLRAGYKAGYDSQGATFGLGIRHRQLDLDYAVQLIRNDLGDSHRVSLGIRL